MDKKQKKRKSVVRKAAHRGLSFLLAGVLAFSNVAPSLGTIRAYADNANPPVNADGSIPNGNKPQDAVYTEEIYVNDTPLRLQVSKIKTPVGEHEGLNPKTVESTLANTITYKISGRVEGQEHDLRARYGDDMVEFAYSANGTYLGYGWLKGTLEYLTKRQIQNTDEELDIKYNPNGIFEGYAYATRTLETADDINRHVAGATMTLYDAVAVYENNIANYDMDDKWKGVTVERNEAGNVEMIYVNKGHAGERVEYVLQKEDMSKVSIDGFGVEVDDNYNYQDSINDTGEGVWIAKTIQREDTPILFYSFDNLHVTTNDQYESSNSKNKEQIDKIFGQQRYNKENSVYGFDKDGNVINIDQYDNRDFSVYAFEDGETNPVFEFVGGDYENIHYSQSEKKFRFYDEDGNEDTDMKMYHLDKDGNRDALVDPTTGIAYLVDGENEDKIYVWPVNTYYDGTGNSQGNEKGSHYFQKIITTRPATINADTENEYVFGTLEDGKFENRLNPVLDQYGHPLYTRVSDETYVKGEDRYDYDMEEYLGFTYNDGLDVWNENAYVINDHYHLYNTDEDDPFNQETHYQYTDKQPIKITIDVDNNFVVNGHGIVPIPEKEGFVFAGWLLEPEQLTDGGTVKAYWRNKNNSMSADEEAMWYSQKAAQGTTVTLTVTFDANGGAFRAGSGDIHSTDFPLYRRLGDAYLINNTWVTGENTPNDPFDTPKVDTVSNTAAGHNTLTGTDKTANDVYSNTMSGGQADMLKRLPKSIYIMEELEAPAGYVKGLPVVINMDETTEVQNAEMVDTTIKVELVKVDAADNYYKHVYRNGEQVTEANGNEYKKLEPKVSYSYEHVKGAVLSLKGADNATKKAFSDWVKVTSSTDFSKKNQGGIWYIQFDTTKPLFLEGIPAGTYTITETYTPNGYVTMNPQTITVNECEGVQLFAMTDDHTKVEIEKYYTDDDGTVRLLPNADRAKLALYDTSNTLVGEWYTNDASDYTSGGATSTASKGFVANLFSGLKNMFMSSDEVDYTSFTTKFQESYNNGQTNMKSVTWNVKRIAELKGNSNTETEYWKLSDGTTVTVENGTVPGSAPAEFAAAYANKEDGATTFEYPVTLSAQKDTAKTTSLGDQYWNVSDGTVIRICASVDDDSSSAGYQSYRIDYQFDYKEIAAGAYAGVITYLTVDGTRRFDYLPQGNYKIRELEAPEGYAVAEEKNITVKRNGDIQIFDLENKKRELKISKNTVDGNGMYFAGYYNEEIQYTNDSKKAAVVGGVKLKLYRSADQIANPAEAFANGAVPANAVLIDSFTTGNDGKYTQYEYERELIRKEMIGQFKPHTVKDVQNGWYYLVEETGLDYMLKSAPVEFAITDATTDDVMSSITMVNRPAPVAVKINKTNEKGEPLGNAVFELTNKGTGAVIGTLVTDKNGEASMNVSDTGKFNTDGTFTPYTFVLQETAAPSGYALNPAKHEFTLSKENDGFTCVMTNDQDDAFIDGVLHVTNEVSQLSISKQDFYSKEIPAGTVLEVTKAVFENGAWKSDGNKKSEWTWTVDSHEDTFGLTGITPNTSYVLHEVSVPAGYTKEEDVFFHTDENGLGIDKIWFDPQENQYVSFDMDETGAVEAMYTTSRTVKGTTAIITDLDTGNTFERGVETNGRILLTAAEVTEGNRYNVKTSVTFSDTTTQVVDSITLVAELINDQMIVWSQYASGSKLVITDENSNKIYEIDGTDSTVTILNPESDIADTLSIADMSRAGKNHSGVKAGDIITYQVDYKGAGKKILIYPGTGLTINRFDPGAYAYSEGSYAYDTTAEAGKLYIVATVNNDAITDVNLKVVIGEATLNYMNPVAITGETGPFAGNDSLVISNAVTGSDPENSTASFQYKVTLTKADGSALSGSYSYRTRNTNGNFDAYGKTKNLEVTLTGNDYLLVNGLPENTKYTITLTTDAADGFKTPNKTANGTIGKYESVNVLFTSHRSITAERALLKKNQSYYLTEVITLTDRDYQAESFGFTLDDKCRVTNFILLNRPTEVEVTKLNEYTQKALAGAVLHILDENKAPVLDGEGNPLTWTSTKAPQTYIGILEAGKTYYVTETQAPDGFTLNDDLAFTVSEDGAVDRIVYQNKPTDVVIKKVDSTTGLSLAGATLQVLDANGTVLHEWETDVTGTFTLTGKLKAGETYTLHESETVDGYYYSYDVEFTVNTDGSEQIVEMRNREIKVVTPPDEFPKTPDPNNPIIWLVKGDYDMRESLDKEVIPGGTYEVYEKDSFGNKTVIAEISDPDLDGKFTMNATWKEWDIVLKADHTYYLREIQAPNGYRLPDGDVEFTVSHYGEDILVPIYNEKIKVSFEKADYAGAEVAGAACELKVLTGSTWTVVDSWVSQAGGPHRTEGTLIAGREYMYSETAAPDGYAYSASIRFRVNEHGEVEHARYVNADGKTLVYDSEGRPTDVTFTETLAGNVYKLGDKVVELVDGNIVDDNGTVLVNGAATQITVVDNVVLMKDDIIIAEFEKTDFAGVEIAGAVCTISILNNNGLTTEIDRWTSAEGESHILSGRLVTGNTYVYHEEMTVPGYEYSYDIVFTVDEDGNLTDAHYIDPDGNPVLYDKKGYPTSIVVLGNNQYQDGADPITINSNGDAVDENGNVRAKGVAFDIPVRNNVVIMKDDPVKTTITKYDENGNAIEGGIYAIYNEYDEIVTAIADTRIPSLVHDGNILAGEELKFAAKKTGVKIDKLLTAGQTYQFKEIQAPKGYTLNADPVEFTAPVYNQEEAIAVSMTDTKIPVRFAKVDGTSTALAGASLELYVQNDDGSFALVKAWTSTTTPLELNGVLEYGKTYKYHEVSAPSGYIVSSDILFTIDVNGVVRNARYADGNGVVRVLNNTIEMVNTPLNVSFAKTDFAGVEVPGAECILYKKNENGTKTKIEEWTSTTEAHEIEGELETNTTYIYHEAAAPDGYAYSEDIEFTINSEGIVTNAHYINSSGTPVLYDEEGFQTEITVQADGTYKLGTEDITINGDGDAVKADGTVVAEGVALEIPVIGNVVQMKDAPTDVTIHKVDNVTGLSLAGATLQVIDASGVVIAEWTTDATGEFQLVKELIAGETYTLREVETVEGYYYSYDVTFTVNEDGKPQTVEMRNRPIKVVTPPDEFPETPDPNDPIIWLLKNEVSDPDHILQGGTFQVLSEDKQTVVIDSFTMNGTLQQWNKVLEADHTYWLHEVTPPEGYGVAADVRFTVSHYGEDVEVLMSDHPTEVIIKKVDAQTGESLAGATLELYKGEKKPPYAAYDPNDKIAEWTTDATGIFKISSTLEAGETYTLHESKTVEGYYYSHDVEFVVNTDGTPQTVEMYNRRIIVQTPPDELPDPTPKPQGTEPNYEMEKERVSLAPEKQDEDKYGFFHGDKVLYDVTIKNTGEIELTMDVDDSFEKSDYFSKPAVHAIRYYESETDRQNSSMGKTNSVNGSKANITIKPDGYAVVTYEADVLEKAKENLSNAEADDGLGYVNTATVTDVVGKYYEYSGEDKDGDGLGDDVTEVTVTKDDYPEELKDRSDDANTPVQEPDKDVPTPSYTMDKERVTKAPEKDATGLYGFRRGDTVTYEVRVQNTGDLPLKMYVSDEFAYEIRSYFEGLAITKIDGEVLNENGTGIGTTIAKIRIEPGEEAVITYEATVSMLAPERLSFLPEDDGNGYVNIAKTYEVTAEKPDGTEGGSDEYPGIEDKEDDGTTPVQTPDNPPTENPPGPNEMEYPIIWLLKTSVNDPSHILPGGTFQILDENGNVVVEIHGKENGKFGIGYEWGQWQKVLEADKTYYLHEVTPPEGYLPADDVAFTVGHYGEKIEVVMTDKQKNDGITFSKQDFAGNEVPGAECVLYRVNDNGTLTQIDRWISSASQHMIKGKLESGITYRYHEEVAPNGYGYSVDAVFTVDDEGNVTEAYYVNEDGETILFDKNGFPTDIVAHENGTYSVNGKAVIINANGDAENSEGIVIALGVQKIIPVTGNIVIIKDEPTKVKITKTNESGTALTGGKFQILDAGKDVVKAISNTNIPSTVHPGFILKGEDLTFAAEAAGVTITKQLNIGEEYYLHEVTAPAGYALAADVMFTIRYAKPGETLQVTMRDEKTDITFAKTDFAGVEVPGAECELYVKNSDGTKTKIDEWASTTTPHVIEGELVGGNTYIYHEAAAPDGYAYSEDIEFTLDGNGNVQDAHYINSDGTPVLYDEEGFQTEITVQADGTYKLGTEDITINGDGDAVKADGTVVAEGVALEIPVIGNVVQMKDAPTDVTIHKVDNVTGLSLAGATLQVIDANGVVIAEWTTDATGEFQMETELTAGETYTLHEEETVEGYYYSRDVEFTVNEDGRPQTVEMRNRPIKVVTPPDEFPETPDPNDPIIWLLKNEVSDPNHILQGGTFQVLSEDKQTVVIDSFTMNGTLQQWNTVLEADHSYWLHEVTPPAGYERAEDVRFTVSHYGEDIEVVMTDTPTDVIIKKTDATTGTAVPGAVLQIIDKNNNVVKEWTTDATGRIELNGELIAGETYILHEEETPEGYYYSRDIQFVAGNAGQEQTIEMRNRQIVVVSPPDEFPETPDPNNPIIWLLKNEIADPDHILQGGTFQVLSEDKNTVVIDNFTMDGTEKRWEIVLEADKSYWLHEVTPPSGYLRAEDVKFTVSHYGEDVEVIMTDLPIEDTVTFTKEDFAGNEIPGAECELTRKDSTETYRWTSTGHPHVIEGLLQPGATYIYKETKSPDGYGYSESIEFTYNDAGIVIDAHYIDANGNPILYDEDGFQTEITVQTDGTYKLGTEDITINGDGDAVKADGTVVAKGVALQIEVVNNVVRMKDAPTDVTIHKVDNATGLSLAGAKLQVIDASGVVRAEWTTDTTGEFKLVEDLIAGETYTLREVETVEGYYYSYDVTFTVNEDGKPQTVEMRNRPIKVVTPPDEFPETPDPNDPIIWLLKNEVRDPDHILQGGTFQVLSEDKQTVVINSFTMNGTLQQWNTVLEADHSYWLHEVTPPAGYAAAEDVKFTVSHYGEDVEVVMTDKPTEVEFHKVDSTTGLSLAGAVLQVLDKAGNVISEWTTDETGKFKLENILVAGETYVLHEKETVDGYYYSYDVEFTVNTTGDDQTVVMRNREIKVVTPPDEFPPETPPTTPPDNPGTPPGTPDKPDEPFDPNNPGITPEPDGKPYPIIWLLKNEIGDPDHILQGGTFQVLSEDKTRIEIDNFTMNGTWQEWDVVLKADHSYWLHEVSAPPGYKKAEDVKFTVSHYGEDVQVVMTDEKLTTTVTFTKEDFAGNEIPGAECELKRVEPNGTETLIDQWTSDDDAHVMKDVLSGSTTYRYHEELAPDGYGYSEDIEFTLDENGKVTDAHYVNEDGTPILYDKDGYPTTITAQPDGTYKDGDIVVTIDGNGNAVDRKGNIHAEGVRYEIEVIDNVIRMKDAPTNVVFLKTTENGTELAGGQFVIYDNNGNAVRAPHDTQIESTEHDGMIKKGEVLRFKAVEGGVEITKQLNGGDTYVLHEEKAPDGYNLASDVSFTVPWTGKEITVKMIDIKKVTPPDDPEPPTDPDDPTPPDRPTPPKKPSVSVYKYDGHTMQYIKGVEFDIYKDGAKIKSVKTGNDGLAWFKDLENGSYRIVEAKAADGYRESHQEFTFTVENGKVVGDVTTYHLANYKGTKIVITKRDGDTGEVLEGATLRVVNDKNEIVYEGRTDENGEISFMDYEGGHFAVVEIEAPEGYDVVDGYITFHVSEKGEVEGETTMYNYKVYRKGKITAKYENGFKRGGWYDSDGRWHLLPMTGDKSETTFPVPFAVFFASLAGLGVALLGKKKKNKKSKS